MTPPSVSAERYQVLSQLVALFALRAFLTGEALTALATEAGQVPGLPPETVDRLTAILKDHNEKAATIDALALPYLQEFGDLSWQALGPHNRLKL